MTIHSTNSNFISAFREEMHARKKRMPNSGLLYRLHLDAVMLTATLLLIGLGLLILFSAANQDLQTVLRQFSRMSLAFLVMFIFAQISPHRYREWAPWFFLLSLVLLIAVLGIGEVGKGARRWLDFKLFRFQPAELMKIALPMALAWFFRDKRLPPSSKSLAIASAIILLPVLLTAKQPDLGTAIMIASAGFGVLLLAGISWRIILAGGVALSCFAPFVWHYMHSYQRQRVLIFLDPERDPLGAGYHIIQSKIAIGSGGFFGKGWLQGTQSHLHFLPEHATDFIFAVCGEELGLIGGIILITLYLIIVGRGLAIAYQAQDTFTRLLAGGFTLIFFSSIFVNIGMVTGLLPVVGLPLPLISYGGTSMVSLSASLGILMSIQTHRKLLSS